MRQQGLVIGILLCFLPLAPAAASPILPAADKPGALMTYQRLGEDDRRATLQELTGRSMASDALYDSLDACTMRQTTEDGTSHWRLSKAVSVCLKELGLPPASRAAAAKR